MLLTYDSSLVSLCGIHVVRPSKYFLLPCSFSLMSTNLQANKDYKYFTQVYYFVNVKVHFMILTCRVFTECSITFSVNQDFTFMTYELVTIFDYGIGPMLDLPCMYLKASTGIKKNPNCFGSCDHKMDLQ